MDPRRRAPLIVTSDPLLLEELLRLTADAGLIADVAPDPTAARSWFESATFVLIGMDMAEACVRAGFRRRVGLALVGRRADGTAVADPADFALAERLSAEHVALLPAAESWIVEQLLRRDEEPHGHIVAVMGGRGGAGASVLAGALALAGSRRRMATLLIDADPLGGGCDLILGWEHRHGLRWPQLAAAAGRVHPSALVDALPGHGDLVVLSWDRGEPSTATVEAMGAALDAGRRGRDLVVVDLPRVLDSAAAMALAAAERAYLVVPAELRACASGARVAATALRHNRGLALVVRYPGPGGLRTSEVVEAVRLPLAGTFRTEAGVRAAVERGEPPTHGTRGSLAALCDRLLTGFSPRRARLVAA